MSTSWARARAHTGWELRLLLRNGEQLLLVFIIPIVLVLALGRTTFVPGGVDAAIPKVLTISILAGCFTSLAIATGFERRSGALRFLATTPLTRANLLTGKAFATAIVTLLSVLVVSLLGIALGWRPAGTWPVAIGIAFLGCLTFAAWGLFLAGTLRAEAVLAVIASPPEAGVYHACCVGAVTKFDWAVEIAQTGGFDPSRIVPVTSADYPTVALRPKYVDLNCEKFLATGVYPLPTWRAAWPFDRD